MSTDDLRDPLTLAEAVARVAAGGIVWDDELPESLRGFGVPALWRVDPKQLRPIGGES